MIDHKSPADSFIGRILSNVLKFPNPGRFGWIAMLLALALALWSIFRSAPSQEELLRLLSLLSFTASIVFSERRVDWPQRTRRPLALSALLIGSSLMFFWILVVSFAPSFNLMALLFAFAMTVRETRTLFLA
jgi:hypothetical protein